MSKKNKAKTPPPQSPVTDLLRKVRLHWDRGDFSQALLAARQCYSKEPTPQIRGMFQEALLKYAEWLAKEGRLEEAKSQFARLFESGEVVASLKDTVVKVAAKLGVMATLPAEYREGPASGSVADEAVFNEQFELSLLPEQDASDVRNIREAFAAWDAGEVDRMREALGRIPRQSALADWRLFLRGLEARVRGAAEDAEANWGRLAADRTPAKLAAAFRTMDDESKLQSLIALKRKSPKKAPAAAWAIAAFQQHAVGFDHVLDDVLAYFEHFHYREYANVSAMLDRLDEALRITKPEILEAFQNSTYACMFNECIEDPDAKTAKPFADLLGRARSSIDPAKNRLQAIVEEYDEVGKSDPAKHWVAYAKDIAGVSAIPDRNKPLAQSLVLCQAAKLDFDTAEELEEQGRAHREVERHRKAGVAACRQAIAAMPDRLAAYEQLAEHFESEGDDDAAFELRTTMAERFPNDVNTLLHLALHPRLAKDPEAALEYARRAQKLKPLDRLIQSNVDFISLSAARRFAVVGKSAKAHDLLASVFGSRNDGLAVMLRTVHEAMIAELDDDSAPFEALLKQVDADAERGLAYGMFAAVESRLYELGKTKVDQAEQAWSRRIQTRQPAGALSVAAGMIVPYLSPNPKSPAWKYKIANALAKSIKTAAAGKGDFGTYAELRLMTNFVEVMPNQKMLYKSLMQKGLSQFPEDAYFAAMEGMREIQLGPRRCNRRRAHHLLTLAKKAIEADPSSPDAHLLPKIRADLTFLDEAGLESPFAGFGRGGGFFSGFADMLENMAKNAGIPLDEMMDAMAKDLGLPPDAVPHSKKK